MFGSSFKQCDYASNSVGLSRCRGTLQLWWFYFVNASGIHRLKTVAFSSPRQWPHIQKDPHIRGKVMMVGEDKAWLDPSSWVSRWIYHPVVALLQKEQSNGTQNDGQNWVDLFGQVTFSELPSDAYSRKYEGERKARSWRSDKLPLWTRSSGSAEDDNSIRHCRSQVDWHPSKLLTETLAIERKGDSFQAFPLRVLFTIIMITHLTARLPNIKGDVGGVCKSIDVHGLFQFSSNSPCPRVIASTS